MRRHLGSCALSLSWVLFAALIVMDGRPFYRQVWVPVSDRECEGIRGGNGSCYYLAAGWAAPHFLVHLKWEFLKRFNIEGDYQIVIFGHLLLLSQDALNSFGVA
jgi:hypothetical protein